ncbi:MAG: YitT family protein [Oscillospiraceae bacterium]|nr:YitT family protein [Oscillospiraceae bacterium]
MSKLKQRETLMLVLFFIVSVMLNAASVVFFMAPHELASAGVAGIAIILYHFTGLGVGFWILFINIPLIIIGIIKFKLKFFATTIAAIVFTAALVELIPLVIPNTLIPFTDNTLLAAIVGGAFLGIAVGLMFRVGASHGGTDIVAKLIRLKYKHIQTGKFYIFFGVVIILAGAIVFWDHTLLLYSAICVVAMSFSTNMVLYGSDEARMVYIITKSDSNISKRLTTELTLGVTYIQGKGAYSDNDKKVLLCAMRNHTVPKARQIVMEEDENAFMIVTKASQVLGWGYKKLDSVDL